MNIIMTGGRHPRIYLSKALGRIANSGISPEHSTSVKNGIIFTNSVIMFSTFALTVNIIQNAFYEEWRDVRDVSIVAGLFIGLFFLNRKGYHLLVKVLTILVPTIAFTFFYIESGQKLDITPIYIGLVLFTFFYFPEKLLRNFITVLILGAYALAHYSFLHLDWAVNTEVLTYPSHFYFAGATILSVFLVQMLMKEKEALLVDTNSLLEEVKEQNQELESFTFVSSHNIKSPLRTINSFAGLLGKSLEQKQVAKSQFYLNYIKQASLRMFNLTEDILMYAKLENLSISNEPLDLNQILKQIEFEMAEMTQKPFRIDYKRLPTIQSNKGLCKVLFENLVENSIKYNVEDLAVIQIKYESRENMHVFELKDNGIGIAHSDQDRIFEMFTRLHTKDKYEGTGIGLAICQKIINLLKGQIAIKSEEGKGTAFTLSIPIVPV